MLYPKNSSIDVIKSAINTANLALGVDDVPFLGLEEIQQETAEKVLKLEHNARPVRDEAVFSDIPLGKTSDERIQEILDGISDMHLPLRLYEGEARCHVWTGKNLQTKEHFTTPIWLIRNDELGHELEIQIEPIGDEPHYKYGHVKGLLYRVDVERQGSFWNAKKFIREQIGELFLEHIGYNTIYGQAMWSFETNEKGNPENDKQLSWRWQPRFAGWDSKLNPIFISGLMLFYYRLGYIADVTELIAIENGEMYPYQQRNVTLLSEAGKGRVREWVGDEAWADLTKYWFENRFEWNEIQKAREEQIPPDEREKRKKEVYEQVVEQQTITDEFIEL